MLVSQVQAASLGCVEAYVDIQSVLLPDTLVMPLDLAAWVTNLK